MRAFSIQAILLAIAAANLHAEPLSLEQRGAPTPSFTLLGDLPGGAFMSRATAVSADGTTVVGYSTSTAVDPNGGHEAFRWKDGQMIGLGGPFPGPGRFSRATGVNGDGSVVVGDTQFMFGSQPFLWQGNTLTQAFVEESFAKAMASTGHYAISSWYGPGVRSYVVSEFSSQQIPMLPGGDVLTFGVQVAGISSDGSAAFGLSDSTGSIRQAFRWKSGIGTTPIGYLPGCTINLVTAVSGDGSLAVGWCSNSEGLTQYFRWTPSTGIKPFPGGLAAVAMSDDGNVMISYGMIWDSQHGLRELRTLLTSWGVDLSGVLGLYATDISAAGNVVVGYAERTDGTTEAFRVVIPEPAAALLIAPMLVMLRRRGAGYRRSAQHRTHLTAAASPSHA